jgi:hypothetical protein
MSKDEVLFWVEEPNFGCKQPVRMGDLLRVKDLKYGWKEEGKIVLVTGVVDPAYTRFVPEEPDDLFPSLEPEECFIIIEGRREAVRIEYLEVIVDQ